MSKFLGVSKDELTPNQIAQSQAALGNPQAPQGASLVWYIHTLAGAVARTVRSKLIETFSALDAGLPAGSSDALRTALGNADYSEPMMYGAYRRINGTDSTVSISDEANFAGQTLGAAAPIGSVKHHYTDGTMAQWDNVGSGTMLVLKNAFNPVRRPDKPADYVGNGTFISLNEHDYAAGFSKGLFFISKDVEFVWTGTKGVASSLQNKAEDGLFAFQQRTTNAHAFLHRILNAGIQVLSIENDVALTRASIKSAASQTNGLYLEAGAGNLTLNTLSGAGLVVVGRPIKASAGNLTLGTVAANTAVETQVPFMPRNFTTFASLPSATTFAGCIINYNGIMTYANGGVWKYVRDDVPVV